MKLRNLLCHPIDTFIAFKQEIQQRSPRGKWDFVRNIARGFLIWNGIHVVDEEFDTNLLSILPGLAMLDYFVLLLYTFYMFKDDLMRALQPLCVIGIAAPSAIVYSFIVVRPWAVNFQSLIFFGGHHIYPLRSKCAKLRETYDEAATMLIRTSLTMLAAIVLSSIVYVIYPIYTYIFENARPMTIPIILPFTDPESDFGYYLNVLNQVTISVCAISGNIGIEFISSIIVNNIRVGVSSIQYALDEFSDFIKHCPHKTFETKYKLRNILMQIRDLDRYIVQLTEFYYWKFLLQPLLITLSVSLAIFCQMIANWTSGYGYALCAYTQLIILCYMGNVAKTANEGLSEGICNVPWYLLPPRYQKMLQAVLHRIQNGARLTIGPLVELNLETATELTKIIYKFLMVLMRIAE